MEGIGAAIELAFKVFVVGALLVGVAVGACGYACASRYSIHVERKP
jgi:hypothetical protein